MKLNWPGIFAAMTVAFVGFGLSANGSRREELGFGGAALGRTGGCCQIAWGASSRWSPWQDMGGAVRPPLAVGRRLDGNLEVFAADNRAADVILHRRQINDNQRRLDWRNVDRPRYQYGSRLWQTGDDLPSDQVQALPQRPDGGSMLEVELLPHFWRRWWFYVVSGLTCIGIVIGIARFVTRARMQRKLEGLRHQDALKKERERIARDIHDQLGASLTRIMMLGQTVGEGVAASHEDQVKGDKIVAFTRTAIQALDETVWAVNPKNDTLDALIRYIGQYADQFFDGTIVRCRREMPVISFPVMLPADVRHDLFLVVKEGLNNVLKHAKASEVRLHITVAGSSLKIIIEDNGCGFDLNNITATPKRNGLENMRKRIKELGGQFSIFSRCGKGTKLSLLIKLQLEP